MNNFCVACGKPSNPDTRFCVHCGAAVERVAAPTPPTAAPPPLMNVPAPDPVNSRNAAPSPDHKSSAMPWRWILCGVGVVGLVSLSAVLLKPSGNPAKEKSHDAGEVSTATGTSGQGPVAVTGAGVSPEPTAPASLSDEERNRFLREGWGFSAENEESIVKQFGNPHNVNRRKVQNRQQPGQMDEVAELQYNGLSVTFYVNQLSELTITDAKFPVAHELGVGATSERIVQLLGKPNEEKDGEISYSDSMSGQSSVHFKCVDGRVVSVTWSFEFD